MPSGRRLRCTDVSPAMSIATAPLLGPRDPPPWRMTGPHDPARPVLLVCDHASWQVPAVLDSLGLQQQVLRGDRGPEQDVGGAGSSW
jgi:hypothetical protein